MLNICQAIVNTLTNDATLTSMVPVSSIQVGPVDVTQENQKSLLMPQINIRPISESVRTVPLYAHDSRVQMDIWSRVSELEVLNIYERVLILLDYLGPYNQNSTHIWWQRLGGMSNGYETSNRLWHYSQDFIFWSFFNKT